MWRTVVRRKYQLTRDRVRLQNQLESLLEEGQLKLSSLVSDLFGLSARRMLRALADGETDPAALAALGDRRLHASQEQLCDALGAATDLKSTYRRLVGMALDELQLLERHMSKLDQEMADLLSSHQDAVQRLAEVPGLGVESAHQIIAEIGAAARTFPSEKHLASWIGVCPGEQESAGSRRATAHPRATASCADCSISAPMLPSRSRAAFSRLSFGVCFHASVSNKQSGRSLTDYRG